MFDPEKKIQDQVREILREKGSGYETFWNYDPEGPPGHFEYYGGELYIYFQQVFYRAPLSDREYQELKTELEELGMSYGFN